MADVDELTEKKLKEEIKAAEKEEELAEEQEETAEEQEEAAKERAKAAAAQAKQAVKKAGRGIERAAGMGGAVVKGTAKWALGGAAGFLGGFLPGSMFDWFVILGLLNNYVIDSMLPRSVGMPAYSVTTATIVVDIIYACVLWGVVFRFRHDGLIWALLGISLEVFMPKLLGPYLHTVPFVKWIFFKPLWPWWSYIGLLAGSTYEPTSFNARMWFLLLLFWLAFFLDQNDFGAWGYDIRMIVAPEQYEIVNNRIVGVKEKASAIGEGLLNLGRLQAAYLKCIGPQQDCTEYDQITTGEQEEVVVIGGKETEKIPTEVKLNLDEVYGSYTSNYVKETGLSMEVEVIRGNDELDIDGEIHCRFSNATSNFTGTSDPVPNEFHVSKEYRAGTSKTISLCKSAPLELTKGNYYLTGWIKFGQRSTSSVKTYFIREGTPDLYSQEPFPYNNVVVPAAMDPNIVMIDLTTKRESPVPVPDDKTIELPLRVALVNNGEGKIDEVTELCLELPDFISKKSGDATIDCTGKRCCMTTDAKAEFNRVIKEFEKKGKLAYTYIPLELDTRGLFDETNNPVDLVISSEMSYNYIIEKQQSFEIIDNEAAT
ncbi:hypothetical protein D6745_02565 [Candidatus Woesearchaeota archaeon]|nr:MAG: hypothetical protein D6745_02565 [Candidatus Woesearchaeota archaeon]